MNTRKAYANVIKLALGFIMFFSAMSMACDEGPTPDNAYGITSPVTSPEQEIINFFDPDCSDNALSGC